MQLLHLAMTLSPSVLCIVKNFPSNIAGNSLEAILIVYLLCHAKNIDMLGVF